MTEAAPQKSAPAWLKLLIDYGPVLAFFIAYRLLRPAHADQAIGEVLAVTKSTLVFIIATVIALILSKWRLGRIEPMLWLTAVLVCGFGALTVYTQDQRWIRHKPTAVYALFSAVLFWGLFRGKPLLKTLLASAFDGLSDEGWTKLSRNWAVFFVFLALLNEAFAYSNWFTFDQWLRAKLVVFMPLSLIFTFAHVPMLMRHGLGAEDSPSQKSPE
ncbi:MAG: hypothetical protein RLY97_1394 [Pseudomonadota bacterium]|jgi:intracellular septation protein